MLPTLSGERRTVAAPHVAAAALLVLAIALGYAGARAPRLAAVAVALGFALVVLTRRPVAMAVLAVPLSIVVRRLGAGAGISVSDVAVAAAALLALPAIRATPELRATRTVLRAVVVYLALLLPGIIAHPSSRALFEWAHRLELTSGAVVIGVWLVRERRERNALRLLLAASTIIAVATVEYAITHNFAPAYPFGLHKNFVGAALGTSLIVLLAGESAHDVRGRLRLALVTVMSLGLLATQSRGGMLAFALGVFVWVVRSGRGVRVSTATRVATGILALGLAVFAGYSINEQLSDKLNANTNSAGVRQKVETYTRQVVWKSSPVTGVGLKYFNTGEFGPLAQAPNNVVDNELAESGVIGLVGFVVLQVAVAKALWRRAPLAVLALSAIAAHLLHGMFDIYWTAGTVSLPFIVVGIGLAASARDRRATA